MNGWETWDVPTGWKDTVGYAKAQVEAEVQKTADAIQAMEDANAYRQKVVDNRAKELRRIRICRIPAFVLGGRLSKEPGGSPGHYWVEIANDPHQIYFTEPYIESYGWYPIHTPSFITFSAPGCLNGDSEHRIEIDNKNGGLPNEAGRANWNNSHSKYPFDPHHNGPYTIPDSTKWEMNHPYIFPEDNRTQEDIIKEIREFAQAYSGDWSYHFDAFYENNCHTFLFNLLYEVDLVDRYIPKDPHFIKLQLSAQKYSAEYRYDANFEGVIQKIKNLPREREHAEKFLTKLDKIKSNSDRFNQILMGSKKR